MDEQAVVIMVVLEGLVAIDRQEGELGDELEALAEDIGGGDIVGILVVGVQRQDTAGEDVHHVLTGGLEDHIPHEGGGQGAVGRQLVTEGGQFLAVGESGEQEQEHGLLKPRATLLGKAADKVPHVNSAVVELAITGDDIAIGIPILGFDEGHLGEACHNAVAVDIAQTPLDVMDGVHIGGDVITAVRQLGQLLDVGRDLGIVHAISPVLCFLFIRTLYHIIVK